MKRVLGLSFVPGFLLCLAVSIVDAQEKIQFPGPAARPVVPATPAPKTQEQKRVENTGTCEVEREMSPTVRGLRLGMTEQEIFEILGVTPLYNSHKVDDYTRFAHIVPIVAGLTGFEDVEGVFVRVYEGRLNELQIRFRARWESLDEYADNVSPKLNVPRMAWSPDPNGARMKCKGFEILLGATRTTTVLALHDTFIAEEIWARLRKAGRMGKAP